MPGRDNIAQMEANRLRPPRRVRWPLAGGRRTRWNGSPFPLSEGYRRVGILLKGVLPGPGKDRRTRRRGFLHAVRRYLRRLVMEHRR
jgi:hypothetical protein